MSKWPTESFLISHDSSPRVGGVIEYTCSENLKKNSSKLLINKIKSLKNTCEETPSSPSQLFSRIWPKFKVQFFSQSSSRSLLRLLADVFPYISNRCEKFVHYQSKHYMKSVQIRSVFWSVFSRIRTEHREIWY